MKRKRIIKGLCIILICTIVLGLLTSSTVEAKAKKGKFTLTYKGKTVVLMTTKTNKKSSQLIDSASLYEVKKAWKDLKYNKKKSWGYHEYYGIKKGKTKIYFYAYGDEKKSAKKRNLGGFDIDIKTKNIALCGVKVGMTKKEAMSILRKQFDKKAIEYKDGSIWLWYSGFLPAHFYIKNGKVVEMKFFCS